MPRSPQSRIPERPAAARCTRSITARIAEGWYTYSVHKQDDEFAPPEGVDGIGEARRGELIDQAPPGLLGPPEREGRTTVLTSGTTGVPKGALRRTPGGFGPPAAGQR